MRRSIALFAATTLMAIAIAIPVSAASPHQVDPAGMVPTLNPDFGPWICTVTGGGPICRGDDEDAWAGADTGLACDGLPIYTTGSFASSAVRWHLPDGRALHTFFNNSATEVWSLSPAGAGPTVTVIGRWNQHYVYPVPGDINQRVQTITGADWQVVAKGVGVVFHDTGLVRIRARPRHPDRLHPRSTRLRPRQPRHRAAGRLRGARRLMPGAAGGHGRPPSNLCPNVP